MLIRADARRIPLVDACVQCVVTSPPYWGLRDYNCNGQLGLEPTPDLYVQHIVEVFREVRRVLTDDGTLWLNLGDSYAQVGGPGWQGKNGQRADRRFTAVRDTVPMREICRRPPPHLKSKDLVGIPWSVAFALRDDGWYLRSDVIWSKPNPMPESVTDRPTKAHEYLFLLTRSERYYYDAAAIAEQATGRDPGNNGHKYVDEYAIAPSERLRTKAGLANVGARETRNKRSVWTVATEPFAEWTPNFDDADYVGADGKPYRASINCLVHAPLVGRRSQQRAEGGEQLDPVALRNLDNDARRVAALIVAHASTALNRNGPSSVGTVHGRTIESTNESRTRDAVMHADDLIGADESGWRTSRTPDPAMPLLDTLGCEIRDSVALAIRHSNEIRRMDHAWLTTDACIPCAETRNDTDGTSTVPDSVDSVERNAWSNTEADSVSGVLVTVTERSEHRNAHNGIPRCNCSALKATHFATFPEALIEPCILAGSRPAGTRCDCDAVIATPLGSGECDDPTLFVGRAGFSRPRRPDEGVRPITRREQRSYAEQMRQSPFRAEMAAAAGEAFAHYIRTDLSGARPVPPTLLREWLGRGWLREPTPCDCPIAAPDIVFDPFIGSGTTGAVAERFGRRWVGTDLTYQHLAKQRTAQRGLRFDIEEATA